MRNFLKTAEALPARAVPYLYWAADRAHRWTGWLLIAVATRTTRVLQRVPWSIRLGVLFALPSALLAWFSSSGQDMLMARAELGASHFRILSKAGLLRAYDTYGFIALAVAFLLAVGAVLAFRRRRLSLWVLRAGALTFAVCWACLMLFVVRIPGTLFSADDKFFNEAWRNDLWINGFLFWIGPAIFAGFLLLGVFLRSSREFFYGRPPPEPLIGDRFIEDIKTHGGDPVLRTSIYWSGFLHLFFIFILPVLLLKSCRTEEAYGLIQGSGVPDPGQQAIIKIIKEKKPKKVKTQYVLNMNSPILFYRPEIEDSMVLEEVRDETQETYVANTGLVGTGGGKLGKGGGKRGGWPQGMAGAKVRFLRLEYDGGDWDQDMGVGADYNMLIQFNKIIGFPIAERTESVPIRQLRRFPKKLAPPFVFITGRGNVSVSAPDVKTLRWYCMNEGGMIFADNGGGFFDSSFRNLMQRAFPELQWVDIANDDPIYKSPFEFPGGAPPLWHHSGNRALGLKHNGRWIVYYHQGDVNDAWKDGHSGAKEEVASAAFKLGINVMNYAFNRYYERHYEQK